MFDDCPLPADDRIPDDYTHLRVALPRFMFDRLLEACLRRGLPLEELIADAFVHAVTTP